MRDMGKPVCCIGALYDRSNIDSTVRLLTKYRLIHQYIHPGRKLTRFLPHISFQLYLTYILGGCINIFNFGLIFIATFSDIVNLGGTPNQMIIERLPRWFHDGKQFTKKVSRFGIWKILYFPMWLMFYLSAQVY